MDGKIRFHAHRKAPDQAEFVGRINLHDNGTLEIIQPVEINGLSDFPIVHTFINARVWKITEFCVYIICMDSNSGMTYYCYVGIK
jgi:hypothetical protein